MTTPRQVENDLKEIRYYYARRDMFASASKYIIESGIIEKVSRYNRAMANAPPRLYALYYALYVEGMTQESFAAKSGTSRSYVKQNNGKLRAYLVQKFNET